MPAPGAIALEEHFLPDFLIEHWKPSVAGMAPQLFDKIKQRLLDPQSRRAERMDEAGIDRMVLSVAGPGVQAEADPSIAADLAKRSNDRLAEMVQEMPHRFAGFSHLAMQSGQCAADELERSVRELGFVGALVNGHTNGVYLDHDEYEVFWERVADLGVPIYIHPADPPEKYVPLKDQPKLRRPTWEWTVETATHALRLVFNGVFDRHPGAKIILGHMGETLPYLLWRFDSRAKFHQLAVNDGPAPSKIIRHNVAITISGMLDSAPLNCAIEALGTDSIMFASDDPFEDPAEAAEFIRSVDIAEDVREKIMSGNARRLLRLN